MAAKKAKSVSKSKKSKTRAKVVKPKQKAKARVIKKRAKPVAPKVERVREPIVPAVDAPSHPPAPKQPESPAHSPGHRRLDLASVSGKGGGRVKMQPAADKNFSSGDRINRQTAQKRIVGFVSSQGQRRRDDRKD